MNPLKSMIAAIALNIPALVAATTVAATALPAASLSVQFAGIETPKGQIMMALFDCEAAFKGGRPVKAVMLAASGVEAKTLVEGLPAGRYAIKSFHDIDGDGKMASNPFGMPLEPYAFSNNAAGPATWADASFAVVAGANVHRIAIK